MIALKITDVGALMNALLKGTLFDHFLIREVSVTQGFTCTIDGAVNADYFSDADAAFRPEPEASYVPFVLVRPLCLELLKGKRKPAAFKFVFLLSPSNQSKTVAHSGSSFQNDDVAGMYLNLTYKNDSLLCTTGISYRRFSQDKSLDQEWDRLVQVFFRRNQIATEQIG